MAASLPTLLLSNRDGTPRSRSRILSLRFRGCQLAHPGADTTRPDGARPVRKPLSVLDPDRHAWHDAAALSSEDAILRVHEKIRANLDRLEWRCQSVEEFAAEAGTGAIDRYNLSDLFEYVSVDHYHRLLAALVRASRPHARLAYWNMLAPRRRPPAMADSLRPLEESAERLHLADRAFFYSAFVLEEVV